MGVVKELVVVDSNEVGFGVTEKPVVAVTPGFIVAPGFVVPILGATAADDFA